jgi:plasmid stabilization system protein ParE
MSAKPVEYHQGATEDVKAAVVWYQNRSSKAASDFVEELQRATDTISKAPKRWPIGNNNARRFLLWRFPFTVIYSEQGSKVFIWAVAHGSRRPEYWTTRL